MTNFDTREVMIDYIAHFLATGNKVIFLLFPVACCKDIVSNDLNKFLDGIESFIDGKSSLTEFHKLYHDISNLWSTSKRTNIESNLLYFICHIYYYVLNNRYTTTVALEYLNHYERLIKNTSAESVTERYYLLLKDIVQPIEKLNFPQEIASLAEEVYYSQKQDAKLVLSDMLEDHNYPPEIVSHLKTGCHPKGCWLIDLILGN